MKCANCEGFLFESEAERVGGVGGVYLHAACAQLAGLERCERCGFWFKREGMVERGVELWCKECTYELVIKHCIESVRETECELRKWGRI